MQEGGDFPKIGVALSGGGARAMGFHLGCLRTLHRLAVLENTRVLSAVSGGSVIAAMYVLHEGTFDEFEEKVRAALRTGFLLPGLKTAVTTWEGPKAIFCLLWCGLVNLLLSPHRLAMKVSSLVQTFRRPANLRESGGGWMPRRFASRTTILRRTLDELLFDKKTLGDLPRGKPRLIAVSAELRTGSAFYFTPGEAGSYRFGKVNPSEITIAHAVTASAAYPAMLPALDEYISCQQRDGSMRTERVTLTDGGVYDNLGLAPLWPDRDPKISLAVDPVDIIIACRAGYGRRVNEPSLFMISRLKAAFSSISNRAQNQGTQRLYDLKMSGRLKNFVLPYLDLNDSELAHPPDDLVSREAVMNYPTDFSAMPDVWIEKLSKRGEQLTLAVIRQHAPELLSLYKRSSQAGSNPEASPLSNDIETTS